MTMHERVVEAGLAAAEGASPTASMQSPKGHLSTADRSRDSIYEAARDPNSNWPEPAMSGPAFEQSMRGWLPPGSPLKTSKKFAQEMATKSPRAGRKEPDRDVVGGVNQAVGMFNATELNTIGTKKYAGNANLPGNVAPSGH